MTKHNWHLRPATKKDFVALYGEAPKNTVKAWSLIVDDKLCGIGGVMLLSMRYTGFCKKAPDTKLPKAIWYKAIVQGFDNVRKMNVNILAIRDTKLDSSKRLLERLGFEIMEVNEKQEIHIWLSQ